MSDVLKFDTLKRVEVDVEIDGKKYVLTEIFGEGAAKYRSAQAECTKLDDGKLSRLVGIGDLQPLLVSLCLFESYDLRGETKLRPVLLSTVRSWPDRVVRALHEKAIEINPCLREKESEDSLKKKIADNQKRLAELNGNHEEIKVKNSQEATTDISV